MTDKATGEVSDVNIEAFVKAFHYIRQNTPYRIVNPTCVWMCRYPWMYRLLRRLVGSEWAYRLVLLYDLILLMRSDYIYKIPGGLAPFEWAYSHDTIYLWFPIRNYMGFLFFSTRQRYSYIG